MALERLNFSCGEVYLPGTVSRTPRTKDAKDHTQQQILLRFGAGYSQSRLLALA
jgi:hypothetical protein